MAECLEKRFQSMLHAYELGMLTDEERCELEMHLLDCPSCRESVKQFQETIRLVRQDEEIRDLIGSFGGEESDSTAEASEGKAKRPRRLLPTLIPATVMALVVIFLLVLKPWQIEISPSQEAFAAKNRLAIMYFDNVADPDDTQRLGQILTNLLITDLAESRYIQVVSHQRLFDLLKMLDLEDTRKIDVEVATSIAEKANAKWMLMGSILQTEPQLVVTAQLVEVETGNITASQRVTGLVNESIFSLVDELSVEIKDDLSLPADASRELDRPVADVTTHSPEAYQLYLQGLSNYYKFYLDEAGENFKEALTYDSTFAMAYYYLSHIGKYKLIDKAVEYSDKASYKEQLFIRARHMVVSGRTTEAVEILEKAVKRYPDEKTARYLLGTLYYGLRKYDKSVVQLRKAIEIDPLYTVPYNHLAYAYTALNDYEHALEAINNYISLVPDEANPYDSRGDIYASQGKYQEAIESYKMALERKPDFRNSIIRLGLLHVLQGDYDAGDQYFRQVVALYESSKGSAARYILSYIPQFQGKLDLAIQALDDGIDKMIQEVGKANHPCYFHLKAVIYSEQGKWDQALASQEKCVESENALYPDNKGGYLDLYIQLLAESGDFDQAERMADSFKTIADNKPSMLSDYLYALGTIERAKGNFDAAVTYLEEADSAAPAFSLSVHYMLGLAYLDAGRYEKAAKEFESLLGMVSIWRLYWGIWSAKSHYYLGQAYENLDKQDLAVESYQKFLNLWKDADPGLKEVYDAKARLGRLQSKS